MRLESLWGDIQFAFRIFKRSPTVVGVARTVFTSFDEAMRATIYSPMSVVGSNVNMLVKTRGGNVSAAMRQIDADLTAAAPGVAEMVITAQDLTEGRVYPFQAISWAPGLSAASRWC